MNNKYKVDKKQSIAITGEGGQFIALFSERQEKLAVAVCDMLNAQQEEHIQQEFVLPEKWYVENFDLATEWAKANDTIGDSLSFKNYQYVGNCHDYVVNAWQEEPYSHTQITRQQFINLVYNPWRAQQEKPRYWKCMDDGFDLFEKGRIYPSKSKGDKFPAHDYHINAFSCNERWPLRMQPATEAEYLEQESKKQESRR